MTNFVDPDQTVPVGAVWSGSTLFAFVFTPVNKDSKYMQQATYADDIFRCIFYILRENAFIYFRETLVSTEYTKEAESTSLQKTQGGDEHRFQWTAQQPSCKNNRGQPRITNVYQTH